MAVFFSQAKITDPSELFGREADLTTLKEYAESLTQIQIIGARRFGKTTVSLCLETLLKNCSTTNVYPVYTDVKTARIKGTSNFYRYLTAILASRLSSDKVFRSRQKFGMVSIKPSSDYLKIYTELTSQDDAYMVDTFIQLCSYFADKLNKTVLVIFDEYEYLAKSTFDNIDGFMPLRDFSTSFLDSGIQPFIFWLVGARPWGCFVEDNNLTNVSVIGGSGEFNGVEIEHYLSPISKEAFYEFWESRCNQYYGEDNSEEKTYLLSQCPQVFDSISGVPFYGNAIAKYLKANKEFPDYSIIKSHLEEALGIFDESAIRVLRSLCTEQSIEKNDNYDLLNDYGLIRCDDHGQCSLSMAFLRDFLVKKFPASNLSGDDLPSSDNERTLDRIVDRIDEVIENINETCRNKNRPPVFAPTEEERRHRLVLKRVCKNEEDFGKFVEVLVKIYYERSKAKEDPNDINQDAIPGLRLAELEPYGRHAYKSRHFFKILEPLRTYYAAHLRDNVGRKPYQMEKGQALFELQGHKNEPDPDKPEQWFELQIKLLQYFKIELNTVKQKVNNLP